MEDVLIFTTNIIEPEEVSEVKPLLTAVPAIKPANLDKLMSDVGITPSNKGNLDQDAQDILDWIDNPSTNDEKLLKLRTALAGLSKST